MSDRQPPYTDMNGRVPMTGPVGKFALLQEYPTWIFHRMDTGVSLDGTAPATALTTPADTEPDVTSGVANFHNLTHGGLFTLPAAYKKAIEVVKVDNAAGATITIEMPALSASRALPSSVPFNMAPGEVLKATGGTAGSYVGFLLKEDLPWR